MTAPPPAAARITWDQVAAWRAGRHHLDQRRPRSDVLPVVSRLCGLHAQLMSSAELTLWARVADLDAGAVPNALWEERSLVKTWAMRGTLHLLPSSEYPMWQAALSRFRQFGRPAWLRGFGITAHEFDALVATVPAALDGPPLTREELAQAVSRLSGLADLGEKMKGSWGSLLKPSAYRGDLCFGPSLGQNVRFTRPDRWLGPGPPVAHDEAARQVTRRYLAVDGPATRDDFARWWGITPAEGRRLLAALGDEVVPVDVEGAAMWLLAEDVDGIGGAAPTRAVRLLPAFDQYVVAATRHADRLLPGPLRDRVYRPQGWLSPVLAVDGKMAGLWRHERKGGRILVAVEPFVPLATWMRRAIAEEAERLAAFLGGNLELEAL